MYIATKKIGGFKPEIIGVFDWNVFKKIIEGSGAYYMGDGKWIKEHPTTSIIFTLNKYQLNELKE